MDYVELIRSALVILVGIYVVGKVAEVLFEVPVPF